MKRFTNLMIGCMILMSVFSRLNAQDIYNQLKDSIDYIVDMNGTGDYTTIQEAINAIPDYNSSWAIIYVKNGIYNEKVILNHKKTKVILLGEDVDSTMVTYDDWGDKMLIGGDPAVGGHTFSTYTFRADANDFQAYNFAFENPTTKGQGVAFHSNGDRQVLYHCRILGNQDTYFDNFRTRNYLKDCFVEGTTDFIFGFGISLFDSCQIHGKGGPITASSTPQYYKFGHVFNNCRITADISQGSFTLGRPWFDYANTVFIKCWLTNKIQSVGWDSWAGRETTCYYREYMNFGPGSDTTNRVSWGKQLAPSLAGNYTIETIMKASSFPSDMGPEVDSIEFWSMRNRFTNSGYTARADTILYAGRDTFPSYPSEDWIPEYYNLVYDVIRNNTTPFMDSSYIKIDIDNILWNKSELEGFDPESELFVLELHDTVTIMPELVVVGDGVRFEVAYPEAIPGKAFVTATSKDKASGKEYIIYLSKDSAFWEAEMNQVIFNREDTVSLIDGVYEYNVMLSEGKTKVTSFIVKNKVSGQIFDKEYPDSYPGVVTMTSTAVDEVTTILYKFNVTLFTNIENHFNSNLSVVFITNPVYDQLRIILSENVHESGKVQLFDMSGKMLYQTEFSQRTEMDVNFLNPGIYLYKLSISGTEKSGKLLKF